MLYKNRNKYSTVKYTFTTKHFQQLPSEEQSRRKEKKAPCDATNLPQCPDLMLAFCEDEELAILGCG